MKSGSSSAKGQSREVSETVVIISDTEIPKHIRPGKYTCIYIIFIIIYYILEDKDGRK